MSSEDIIAIIKWGPLIFFLLTFLVGMLTGLIKGRRKVVRRLIYVVIYVTLIYTFTPKITQYAMTLTINGVSIEGYINDAIENNENLQNIFSNIPGLRDLLTTYPSSIASLVVFLVLIIVGLPLLFPIYWIYLIIYSLIEKYVFKYSKYQRDEKGKILRNEKKKKIKIKRDKHRLTGALLKGAESVALSSVILMPVGVVTRLYKDGKEATINNNLSDIEILKDYEQIIKYVDVFNDSIVGRVTNSKINEKVTGYLTPIVVEGNKSTLENELSSIVVAAVYIEQSGLIKLLSQPIDLKTLDLNKLNMDCLDKAVEMIFNSVTLKSIITGGVNFVLENNLKETLVNLTQDGEIIDKIKYENADAVKQEILRVTDIVKTIINVKILEAYQNNSGNLIGAVNTVTTADVETILNKVLSIQILSKSMPGIVGKLLKDYGLTSSLTMEDNNSFLRLLVDTVSLIKTLEIQNLSDVTEGNMIDNITSILYKEGTIKENSKEALVTLLVNINSSRVFKEVLVAQLNKILEKYEIKLNSQMITRINTKEDWRKELLVLENIFDLYDEYQKDAKVDFLKANQLLENLKETKAIILALPISYQKLFPKIGIEVDLEKVKYIDYSLENAETEEAKFYNYWKQQLTHFEVMSEEMAKLNITSVSDISLELLEIKANVNSIAKIISEVFSTDLIKEGVTNLLNENLAKLVADYGMNLNEDAISNVNDSITAIPYYIVDENNEYDIYYDNNKSYINGELVIIEGNEVSYNGKQYTINNNSLERIWAKELTSLSNIVKTIKTGDYTNKENLTIILTSVDEMILLKDVKVDLLMYAVKNINILDEEQYETIDRTQISFSKEKDILLNIIDEYELITNLGDIEIESMDDDTITSLSNILNNVLTSDIFGDYAATHIVNIAKSAEIELTKESVLTSKTWEADLKLMRNALNMSSQGFEKYSIEEILVGIKTSNLLSPIKEQLLLDTMKNVNIDGVTLKKDLNSNDINYDDEMAAILAAADNMELIEEIASPTYSLTSIDDNTIASLSNLLSTSIKSKIFGDSVVTNLVNIFNQNDIKHDLDDIDDNTRLIESIKRVNDWNIELTSIKMLLNINNKEGLTQNVFDTIERENSLLDSCKANLMIKMVKLVNDDTLNVPSVSVLTANNYAQYKIEKSILLKATDLEDEIKSVDFETMTSSDEQKIETVGDLMDKIKVSVIFEKKYDDIINDITDTITSEEETISIVDEPNITSWKTELTTLISIKERVNDLDNLTLPTADPTDIGEILDLIDDSDLITKNSSQSVANKVISEITNNEIKEITKEENQEWSAAFETIINELKGVTQ